jgi:small multidrug resistance family-3 protein
VVVRSVLLYTAAGLAELGGAWLVWQGLREHRSVALVALGALVLIGYGTLIALQPAGDFGRVMAAYGGLFIVAALVWGRLVDGFVPDRFDVLGAAICLVGAAVIIYAPRAGGA